MNRLRYLYWLMFANLSLMFICLILIILTLMGLVIKI